jgi:tetratricopeptide (TPR) repeat protein
MSFDKTKAMRSAERFLSQGKIRAAIGEYKQVVEHDPKDFGTLNMLGDLYAKNADKKEAVECFARVADYYGRQGFAQKAIAVYNKISRLKPDSPEITAKLAELYRSKGSFAEARVHYGALAEQFERAGKKIEALSVWKQIAELDPHNSEVYLKIGHSFLEENQKDEATEAFTIAGERLSAQGKHEAALDAFSQTLEIRQNDLRALNGFVRAQISLGDSDEAAKTLEQILVQQPFNREILHLLADCHLDTENPHEAEKSILKLVEQEPANYPKFLELVRSYLKNNDLESAARILSISSEHLLVGGQSEEFLKWTNEILARNPEQIPALRLLVRFYGWQRDEAGLRQALERLAEGARAAESIEDEHYALSQLIMIAPHEVDYASRLQEIGAHGDFPVDYTDSPILSQPLTEENQFAGASAQFESFAPQYSDESNVIEARFAANGFGDYSAEFDFAASNGSNAAGEKDFAFVGANVENIETQIIEEFDEDEYDSFGKSDNTFEAFSGAAETAVAIDALSAADEMRLEKELESIEFYVAQGYKELAEKSLNALEAEFGTRGEFSALREQMNGSVPPAPFENTTPPIDPVEMPSIELVENDAETILETNAVAESVVSPIETKAAKASVKDFDFLDDFRNDLGFEENDPASVEGDYETHYQTAIAYKEMGLMEEAIREFQDAINLVSPNDGTRRFFACAHLLGHCFMEKRMPNLALMWYKRALETERLKTEEKQGIWYEIGNAYEVGGDVEKALENFELIYALNVDYRDVSQRIQNLHIAA